MSAADVNVSSIPTRFMPWGTFLMNIQRTLHCNQMFCVNCDGRRACAPAKKCQKSKRREQQFGANDDTLHSLCQCQFGKFLCLLGKSQCSGSSRMEFRFFFSLFCLIQTMEGTNLYQLMILNGAWNAGRSLISSNHRHEYRF